MTDPTAEPCLFCKLPEGRIVMANTLAMAVRDGFPASPGHTLIIPKRHVATFFDATSEKRLSMLELMDKAKRELDAELHLFGNAEKLLSYHGASIQNPQSASYLPSSEFLDWHEEQVFKKPGRDAN